MAFKKAGPADMKIEARGKRPSAVHPVQEAITVRIPDAVRLTGMSRSRIYLLIAQGDIESVKVGRTRLIRIDSLKRYLLQETPRAHD